MKEEEKKVERQPSAVDLIEDAVQEMCLNYCKHVDKAQLLQETGKVPDGDEWLEAFHCRDCPANKLW